MSSKIIQVTGELAENLCRNITLDLPEYFGLPDCNEHYAKGVRENTNFAIQVANEHVGLLSLNFPYPKNANIYWMALFKKYHGQGYGKRLIQTAVEFSKQKGAKTMTVETLSPNAADQNYLKTYHFYEKIGFMPLFNLKPEEYVWEMVYMCKILTQ